MSILRKTLCFSIAAALSGLIGLASFATAGGCGCGGGGVRTTRPAWGGHLFGARRTQVSAGCGMSGMNMPMNGMNMPMTTAAPVAAPAATTTAASYTCPMHPKVVSATPGACPVCKMALVPK